MARKKTKRKTTTHRRRRSMGSVGGKIQIADGVKLVGGMIIGSVASNVADRFLSRFPPLVGNLVKIGGGLYLAKSNNSVIRGAGFGMASAGTLKVAYDTGILGKMNAMVSGIYSDENYMPAGEYVNGIGITQAVSGLDSDTTVMPGISHQFPFGDVYNPGTLGRFPNTLG